MREYLIIITPTLRSASDSRRALAPVAYHANSDDIGECPAPVTMYTEPLRLPFPSYGEMGLRIEILTGDERDQPFTITTPDEPTA